MFFLVRVGTVMQNSNLTLGTWIMALYLILTSPKGIASLELAQKLGITQKSAWHFGHRIRECWEDITSLGVLFDGPVEADKTYIGGSERNKHYVKKTKGRRYMTTKAPIVGARERETGEVSAAVLPLTDKFHIRRFIRPGSLKAAPSTPMSTIPTRAWPSLSMNVSAIRPMSMSGEKSTPTASSPFG